MAILTEKQQRVYDFILRFTSTHGYPPSIREIGAAVGLKSPSTVHFHIKGLVEAGVIVKQNGKTRAISMPGFSVPFHQQGAGGMLDTVPIVGNVAAGMPILAQECMEGYLHFPTNGRVGEHFALRVRGESMLNAGILPDDLVVVHQQSGVRNGDIVVALFEEEATVKTYRRRNGHVWLMPENEEYQPIDGDHAKILGKVIGVVRHY